MKPEASIAARDDSRFGRVVLWNCTRPGRNAVPRMLSDNEGE